MAVKYEGKVPGTLLATRQAPGNRGGLRLRIFGSLGGLEWDMEACDQLKLNIFGQPDQIFTRGHGHGLSPRTEDFSDWFLLKGDERPWALEPINSCLGATALRSWVGVEEAHKIQSNAAKGHGCQFTKTRRGLIRWTR